MKATEFVTGVKSVVCNAGAQGVIKMIENPPGRCPSAQLLALNQWYSSLHQSDREMVVRVASMVSDQAGYNLLLLLDGLLTIESSGAKGKLSLIYEVENSRIVINDPDSEDLSSLFKAD